MEKDEKLTKRIRQLLYQSEPYVVNDKELAQVVTAYINGNSSEKLFVFGHPGIGKTAIIQHVSRQNQFEIQKFYIEDVKAGLTNIQEDIVEIECSIRDLYDAPLDVLTLNLPQKIIVEVTVDCEGDARNFIIDNHDSFYWVYYRESPEDALEYMSENSTHHLVLDFFSLNPERISSLQARECEMFQEGLLAVTQAKSILDNHQDTTQLSNYIIEGLQLIVSATISDEPIRIPAKKLSTLLFQYKDEIDNPELVVRLGVMLTRDMPYVGDYFRKIE